MLVVIMGGALLFVGALALRFPLLVDALQSEDRELWKILGSPPRYAFSKTLGVFSWILARGYEQSTSALVREQGRKALPRALFAQYAMLLGVALLVSGAVMLLVGSFN